MLFVMADATLNMPAPLQVDCQDRPLDELLDAEWLLTNELGAYASSSAAGCNTRRYHGLLIASTRPPVGRLVTLSTVMEQLIVPDDQFSLATNEFAGMFSPAGYRLLQRFQTDAASARFVYRCGELELVKEVVLAARANAVAIRYTLTGGSATLQLRPFASLRNFHHVRRADQSNQMTFDAAPDGLIIHDRRTIAHNLHLAAPGLTFAPDLQWWYRFHYRADAARGQGEPEDLYSPGVFSRELADGEQAVLFASLDEPTDMDAEAALATRQKRVAELAEAIPGADETTQRLAVATDAFVVRRQFANAPSSASILAGYHWFADWGRDAFIALPGLLLETGRFELAREVFKTFAAYLSGGMIPNCFDDDGAGAAYNSIDASLWFVIAAERYLQATGDTDFWTQTLLPPAAAILASYERGAEFDIHADADGLLAGGSAQTQLTWMDAMVGGETITPRYGKAVEVNALWYAAHRILAERCRGIDDRLADHHGQRAALIAPAFVKTFWNQAKCCCFDCVSYDHVDTSIRPNQIFAVSLPHSPLDAAQQQSVVGAVRQHLLTPFGLRTLSPDGPAYRGRYAGDRLARDQAYHQGTVWAWLMGPFIEAFLKVSAHSTDAARQADEWLEAFGPHLARAGLGSVSEVFDGDAPHRPGGCVAQAWSVAEVLRAKRRVARCLNPTSES